MRPALYPTENRFDDSFREPSIILKIPQAAGSGYHIDEFVEYHEIVRLRQSQPADNPSFATRSFK